MYNIGIKYPMTIETSFSGTGKTSVTPSGIKYKYLLYSVKSTQFRIIDLERLGYKIAETLYVYDQFKHESIKVFETPICFFDVYFFIL